MSHILASNVRADDATTHPWPGMLHRAREVLASSLDYEWTLRKVAQLAIPDIADWSVVDIVKAGILTRVALHPEPDDTYAVVRRGPVTPNPYAAQVLQDGRSHLIPYVRDEHLRTVGRDPGKDEQVRVLLGGSTIVAALRTADEVLGVLTLVRTSEHPPFAAGDLAYAEELGRIAGTAIARSRTHTQVAGNRDQLDAILRAINDGITVLDATGRVIFANDAAARLTRRPAADHLVSRSGDEILRPFTVFGPDGQPLPVEDLPSRKALKGVASENVVLHYRYNDDGSERWSSVSATPLFDQNGGVNAVVSVFRDITDQRRAFEANARLAAIVDSSDDAIISKDLDGTVRSWNRGAQAIFGYSANEIVGKSIKTLIPPELQDEEDRILAEIRAGNHVRHYETKRLRKDGSIVDVSLTISPIRDETGKVVGASKIGQDITEQKRAREQLRRMNQELEQRVRLRTQDLEAAIRELEAFNYTVSHDLRTPLRAILGFAKLLLQETTDDVHRQRLSYIRDAAEEMSRMTETLLRLTRIQQSQVRREKVDLTQLASNIVDRLRRASPERDVDVQIEDGLEAAGDAMLLEVALENLISNAWKFTARRPKARITFGRRTHRGRQAFYVEDNGIGFTKEDAALLFKPFHRLRPAEFDGNGIGLATVQRILRVHDGGIDADGEHGQRATIYFWL